MFEIYAVAAVALVAVGVIAGILVIFAVGIRSEDRAGSQRRPELALVGPARPGRPSVRTW
jgi:hypothetical protein